eukprot:GFYU01012675.1.p1 GENE.GFYU01012675.1~~GFYU01012675.1.p1  ORF type:complete len:450 (-),score=121.24 GFYU01012675.1:171-1487(-)
MFCKGTDWRVWTLLLAAYFDQTSRPDRQKDELPYHLAKVFKGKLAKQLSSWEMFSHHYSDFGSPKLIEFWNSAGSDGLDLCGQMMTDALRRWTQECVTEDGSNVEELQRRQQMVGRFLCQAGLNKQAIWVMQWSRELEESRNGTRTLRYADILFDLGNALMKYNREISKYVSAALGREYYKISLLFEEGVRLRRELGAPAYDVAMGLLLFAEVSSGEAGCNQVKSFQLCARATQCLAEVNQILEEHGDPMKIKSYVMMETGLILRTNNEFERAEQMLKTAADQCLTDLGQCLLYCRILYNWFMVVEDSGRLEEAYRLQKRGYDVACRILGPSHSLSVSGRSVLDEPVFRNIARQLGQNTEVLMAEGGNLGGFLNGDANGPEDDEEDDEDEDDGWETYDEDEDEEMMDEEEDTMDDDGEPQGSGPGGNPPAVVQPPPVP